MSIETRQVKRFYEQIWNQHSHTAVAELLDENLTFRASLGTEVSGIEGFTEYLDMVHAALSDYQCRIVEIVCQSPKVFARLNFCGVHSGELLGYPPTEKRVSWQGAALYTFSDGKVVALWVLGDIKALEQQLSTN